MLITSARLERNPTVKEQVRDLSIENISYGHLGYPVLQAADILLYKGDAVPVGEDQVPHVEITREIARRFNQQYGNVFPEPEAKLTKFPRLPGLDGKMKMSKSAGNTILLSDSPDEVKKKMSKAVTDPQKVRKNDPGHPEVCLVFFAYHHKFNPTEVPSIERDCRSGVLGCVDCKLNAANHVSTHLVPIREKRAYFEKHPGEVKEILHNSESKAQEVARQTMTEVHEAMGLG